MSRIEAAARALVAAPTARAEHAAATALIEAAEAQDTPLTLTLRRPDGGQIPIAAFSPDTKEPVVVEIAFAGAAAPIRWQPRDLDNVFVLMQE